MQSQHASHTALSAAVHRAAHQLLEHGSIFDDPLALPILGEEGARLVRESAEQPDSRRMRLFIAARTRFAEEALRTATERGVRQLVILGAGLDTYACRGSRRDGLRMFEVDHPATQSRKRERLRVAAIAIPAALSFVAVDFERDALAQRLAAAGFDAGEAAFFTWLGVVPYSARPSCDPRKQMRTMQAPSQGPQRPLEVHDLQAAAVEVGHQQSAAVCRGANLPGKSLARNACQERRPIAVDTGCVDDVERGRGGADIEAIRTGHHDFAPAVDECDTDRRWAYGQALAAKTERGARQLTLGERQQLIAAP